METRSKQQQIRTATRRKTGSAWESGLLSPPFARLAWWRRRFCWRIRAPCVCSAIPHYYLTSTITTPLAPGPATITS